MQSGNVPVPTPPTQVGMVNSWHPPRHVYGTQAHVCAAGTWVHGTRRHMAPRKWHPAAGFSTPRTTGPVPRHLLHLPTHLAGGHPGAMCSGGTRVVWRWAWSGHLPACSVTNLCSCVPK